MPDPVSNPARGTAPARRQIGVGGFTVSSRAKALVAQVLDSGRLTAGPMMARFEGEVARLHGCRHARMCDSGTAALQMALAALAEQRGWKEGDEVVVPAVTFVATANVVLHLGLRPVFADVDPTYYTLDPDRLAAAVTPRTRAVMPVHVGGLAADMDPILEAARAHDMAVLEDCAEAMFATYRGRPVGSLGDVGAFSTYAAHIVTTGVGGVCTTNRSDLHDVMTSVMNHGRDLHYIRIDDDQVTSRADLAEVVDRRFSFVRLGHSFRATEMEAALGVAQLEEREALCRRRREIAARYDAGLADLADHVQLPRVRPGCEHVYMFYPVVVTDPGVERLDLVIHLEERGVETRYLLPLVNQPVYRARYGDLDAELPVAARLNATAFYVGCHPAMTDDDVDHVISAFHDFFGSRP